MLRRSFTRILLVCCGLTAFVGSVLAQQAPALSTYAYNLISVNPAYSGYYEAMDISMAVETTLPHVDGAQETGSITINGPGSAFPHNMGLGGGLSYDKIGVTTTLDMYVAYAYKIISRNQNSYTSWGFYPKVLSLGLQAGLSNVKEDLASLGINDDPNFAQSLNQTVPYFGVGIFYSKKHFYMGLSAPRLYHSFLTSSNNIQLSNHYYFQGGYQGFVSVKSLVKTAMMVRYVEGAPFQLDMNLIFEHNNLLELGTGYRSTSGINLLAGIHLYKTMRLIYYFNVLSVNSSSTLNNATGILLSIRPSGNFSR